MTIISVECFNPRAPCGARPTSLHGGDIPRWFQSTRPVWGATTLGLTWEDIDLFQSTRPVWGATFVTGEIIRGKKFQSTRPVWGATAKEVTTSLLCHVFMCIPLHKYDFLGT